MSSAVFVALTPSLPSNFDEEKAMELTGMYGLSGDIERYFRDAKIMEIWEGTSEVEKLIIARMLEKESDSSE